MRTHSVATRLKILGPILIALLALAPGCNRVPPLRPYDERTNNQFMAAPMMILGLAEDDQIIGQPVPAPQHSLFRLHKVTVLVENVLKGTVPEHVITVYYFTFASLNFGTRLLVFHKEPVRRVLWLRKDRGVYRAACDWQNCTMWVETGAHPGYRPDPGASIDQIRIDLLLTRGEGPVNKYRFVQEMGGAIELAGMDGYTIEEFRNLALTESSEVKLAACRGLWTYSQPEIGDHLRERARDSISTAGCTCGPNKFGQVVCE